MSQPGGIEFENRVEGEAELERLIKERRDLLETLPEPGQVPDAPFKKTWPLLTIKRMVRYAAENDFDTIAWTTGELQAERYDLSKQINMVSLEKMERDTVPFMLGQEFYPFHIHQLPPA